MLEAEQVESRKPANQRITGKFKKGQSGNPGGMKKGEFRRLLEKAIASSDAKEKLSLAEYAVKRARTSDVVLVALLKKLVPDLKHVEGKVDAQTIADIFAIMGDRSK